MVYTDTAVSFPDTPVHISIQHKIHISVVFHTNDLNIVLVSCISEISIILLTEAENSGKLTICRRIGPQITLLNKCQNSGSFIHHIFHILISYPKEKSLVRNMNGILVEYLGCTSLEIQKHNSGFCVAHSVKLCYIINFLISIIIQSGNLIFQGNTGSCLIDILHNRDSASVYLRA